MIECVRPTPEQYFIKNVPCRKEDLTNDAKKLKWSEKIPETETNLYKQYIGARHAKGILGQS